MNHRRLTADVKPARMMITIASTVIALAALGISTHGQSQDSAGTSEKTFDQRSPETIVIFPLRHASAIDVARVIRDMGVEAQMSVDGRTNSLIVRTTEQGHSQVRMYVGELDRPIEPAAAGRRIQVFQLENTTLTPGIQKTLIEMFSQPGVKLSLDSDRGTIVAEASDELLERIGDLLAQLDRASDTLNDKPSESAINSYRARIVWLVTDGADGDLKPTPNDLGAVVKELDNLGVSGLATAANLLTRVKMNQEFSVQASPSALGGVNMQVSGRLIHRPGEAPSFQLMMMAQQPEVTTDVTIGSGPSRSVERLKTLASIQTTIDAPIGHFVVLGVTPIGERTSVLVVQLQPGEQKDEEAGTKRVW